ncbi:class I SAM-dependent methyltransferase [Magnetovibrio sp. PR-2]|uniref:class I SAM-dependent methyltransferase n=1 Tax=Magnetovibrio sp. PR-2 TaxID=3120356 RepID=UPI002FCE3E44
MPSPQIPMHLKVSEPSPWVIRWALLADHHGSILDLAAGNGRHGRLMLGLGCHVTFLDRDTVALRDLKEHPKAKVVEADLEDAIPWPLEGETFDAIIVVNYLHRPLFDKIIAALNPGGILIYETFALGNEDYARPRNPDHLLKSGELLELVQGKLQVVGYEHGLIKSTDIPGVKQRLCAINDLDLSVRDDGEPPAHEMSRV